MLLGYSGGFAETVEEIGEHERAGLDIVLVPEAYSFDAVSQLGFLAARTSRLEIAAGILQIYTRTPSLTAMTAAGLDFVSDGRFTLGLGASGPQVVEGFHGVRYDAPLARTREIVEICRQVWRRERVEHDGRHYRIPLPAERGHRPRQAVEAHQPPGPRAHPDRAGRARAAQRRAGRRDRGGLAADLLRAGAGAARCGASRWPRAGRKRDPALGPLDVVAPASLCVTDDADLARRARDGLRPFVALYAGGMGARGRNFYNDVVAATAGNARRP